MTDQERTLISDLADRIRNTPPQAIDRDADDLIRRTIGTSSGCALCADAGGPDAAGGAESGEESDRRLAAGCSDRPAAGVSCSRVMRSRSISRVIRHRHLNMRQPRPTRLRAAGCPGFCIMPRKQLPGYSLANSPSTALLRFSGITAAAGVSLAVVEVDPVTRSRDRRRLPFRGCRGPESGHQPRYRRRPRQFRRR